MSIDVYGEALLSDTPLRAEYDDGVHELLDVPRWLGSLDAADARLLARVTGPVLDVGCGPGRLAAALTARGVAALGVDIAPEAVALARRRGATAVTRSVFDLLPDEGSYAHVLLADGNIGIGGDPLALLRRCAALLLPGGRIHVEVGAAGDRHGAVRARLHGSDGRVGAWFPWAHVNADRLGPLAAAAGLTVVESWKVDGRWFAELRT